jgi:serine/threonine protein kinase
MTLSPKSNQLPATRRRHTEIEHDDKTSTKADTSEEEDRVHDNANRKGTSLWSRFVYLPGFHVYQYAKQTRFSLFQCLQYHKRSGALPVWTTNRAPKCSRWVRRRRIAGTSLLVVILDLMAVVYFTFYCPVTHTQNHYHFHYRCSSRPTTDQEVDRLPIILGRSGTISSSSSFSKRDWSLQSLSTDNRKPSAFGGIEIESLQAGRYIREIHADDTKRFEREREKLLREDDHEHVPFAYWHQEELSDLHTACRRAKWMEYQFPNCNDFHHFDLSRNYDEVLARLAGDEQDYDNYYINRGFYRDVWVNMKPAVDKRKTILKTMQYTYDFNYRDHYNVNREALVMERLAAANNIVDVHGHCATSVLVEAIPFEVEEYIIPGSGYLNQGEVRDEPYNPFSPLEKLEMAVEMAESIAVLHGFKDGVIVHNDIQLRQWLRTREGRLKLGDFNRAKFPDWNDEKENYCKFNNGVAFGNVRFALSSYPSSCWHPTHPNS